MSIKCDDVGRIYVADEARKQLLIFDSLDGELLQEIELESIETIWDLCWANDRLVVLYDHGITLFNLCYIQGLSSSLDKKTRGHIAADECS